MERTNEETEQYIQALRQSARAVTSICVNLPDYCFEIDDPHTRFFFPVRFSPDIPPDKVHEKLCDLGAKLVLVTFAPDIIEQRVRGRVGDLDYRRLMQISNFLSCPDISEPTNVIKMVRVCENIIDNNRIEIDTIALLLMEKKIISATEAVRAMTHSHLTLCV